MIDTEYLSNAQAQVLLGISKSSFYRHFYKKLISHPTTVECNGSPRYARATVLELLQPVSREAAFKRRIRMAGISNMRHKKARSKKGSNGSQLSLIEE